MFDQVLKRLYKQPIKGVVNLKTKSCKFRTLTINPSVNNGLCKQRLTNLLNTSQRLVNKNNLTWWYVFKTSWRCLQDVFARRLEDVLKTSWRCFEEVLKTSWRRMDKRNILVLTKTSWRRLEDVLWRRMINENIFVFKTSSSRRMFAVAFL